MSNNNSDIRLIQLNSYVRPTLVENKYKDWVLNGKNNSFYQYVIDRFNGSPTNSAIINTYVDLIYGRGLAGDNLEVLNEMLSDEDLRKIIFDFYLFGEASIQVLKKRNKKELPELKHIAKNKIVPQVEDEEGSINGYWYSNDWKNTHKNKPEYIPAFGTSNEGVEIFNIKPYKAGKNYFSDPDYLSGLPYAEIEEEIANYCVNHIKNGLSFGYIVNIPDGANWKAEQREDFERKLKGKLTGSNNAGKFVLSFNGRDTEVKVTPLQVNSAHKQWDFLVGEARQQLITSHRVTSPMLFGIKDNTGLGNNADELDTAEKQLYKRVIAPKQKYITDALETILDAYGKDVELEFLPLTDYEEEQPKEEKVVAEPKEEDVVDDSVDDSVDVEMSICCSNQDINKVIDGVADDLIALGETIDDNDYELIDDNIALSFDLTESKLNNIIQLAQVPTSSKGKSKQDTSLFLIRYKYAGNENPEREFCQKVIKANKVYKYEDLETASEQVVNAGFGLEGADTYNIALYKGGVNCKHWWQRKIYLKKGNKSISVNQARKMILELEPKDRPKAKWEANPKEVSQIASESNNFWKVN